MRIARVEYDDCTLNDIDLELERIVFVFDDGTRIAASAAGRGEPNALLLHADDGRLNVIPAVSNQILVRVEAR